MPGSSWGVGSDEMREKSRELLELAKLFLGGGRYGTEGPGGATVCDIFGLCRYRYKLTLKAQTHNIAEFVPLAEYLMGIALCSGV